MEQKTIKGNRIPFFIPTLLFYQELLSIVLNGQAMYTNTHTNVVYDYANVNIIHLS